MRSFLSASAKRLGTWSLAPALSFGLRKEAWGRAGLAFVIAFSMLPGAPSAQAVPQAVFIVNSLGDLPDLLLDGICEAAVSQCTLRAAIQEANFMPGPDLIQITTPGTIFLSGLFGPLPVITETVDIVGLGAPTSTVDAQSQYEIFNFDSGTSQRYNLVGLQLAHGNNFLGPGGAIYLGFGETLTVTAGLIFSNTSTFDGGGLYVDNATAVLSNTIVTQNQANAGGGGLAVNFGSLTQQGGAIDNNTALGGSGGGLLTLGSFITLDGVQVFSNTTGFSGGGGGLSLNAAALTLANSSLYNNVAGGGLPGGGLYALGGSSFISNTQIYSNQVQGFYEGGGLYQEDGSLTVINSSVHDNLTTIGGGGGIAVSAGNFPLTVDLVNTQLLKNSSGSYGGGLYARSVTNTLALNLTDVTVGGSYASFDGAGIYVAGSFPMTSPSRM